MKRIHTILLILTAAILASCTHEPAPSEQREILLQAGVGDLATATKAPCTITTITSLNPLNADVWISTTSGVYPDSGDFGKDSEDGDAMTIAYHNTASFVSNDAQGLTNAVFYPLTPNDTPVYLCGLYPQGAWALSGGDATAACTFDGSMDVMFAPEADTNLAESLAGTYPMLTFGHLLTWLRIYVKAENANMINAWGALQSIQLQSAQEIVSMDLSTGTPSFTPESLITMATYATGGDTPFTGQSYTLTTTPVEKAYVLCAPVSATDSGDEYTLVVRTANRTDELIVPVNLKATGDSENFTGSTAGKQFSVVLTFGQGTVTTSVTAVNGWQNGGLANGDLTE